MSSVHSGVVPAKISAAILAGGRASRFGGVDKSALVVDGAPILERQVAALAPVADDITLVGHHSERRNAPGGLPVIPDAIAGAGPMGGLYTALVAARHRWVLVVACDMPFVSSALFAAIRDALTDDVDAVVPRSPRGLEPLCAAYSRTIAPVLKERIERGERQLRALSAVLRVRELETGQLAAGGGGDWWFENVNTPHDYARATEVKR